MKLISVCRWAVFALALSGILTLLSSLPASAGELPRLVLFDIELQDESHEGEIGGLRDDQVRRLGILNVEARKLFEQTGRYQLVDISSAAEEIE
ncbi:MAG: DUF2380 domain-containing protein, partial [Aestuariivirgaceae bacterium]